MRNRSHRRAGFAWLELLLALALLSFVFQLFPSLWFGALWALDIRNWTLTVWLAVQIVVLMMVVVIRFWPDLKDSWEVNAAERTKGKVKADRARQAHEAKERRLLVQQAKAARSRRIY